MNRVPDSTGRQNSCLRSAASSSSPGPSRPNALMAPYLDGPPARKRARREGWDSGNSTSGRQLQEFNHSSVRENGRAHFGDHYGDVHYHNRDTGPACHPRQEHGSDLVAHLMESLKFDQMDARRETISRAHSTTCKWIFDRPEYIDWRDVTLMLDHCGFLWIKSKPGAGKSTLMKFLLQSAHEHLPHDTIISFFFNARGDELERSLEGCYRGLLHQLLTKIPRLHDALTYSKTFSDSPRQWSLVSLREMFSEAILQLGEEPLTCFIDALDECPEAEIRDMIEFFEELGALAIERKINLHVCLSSRYYPNISIGNCRHLQLDQQDGHQQDITKYVKSKLKVRKGEFADEIRLAVQDKAQGVFMWVVLVVRILNEESDRGRNNEHLRQCLERIPSELHKLFQDILQRGVQDDQTLLPILQWISFSRRPLTREELYFAVRSGGPDFTPSIPWNPDEDSLEVMDLFILNASKGLAEATKSKTPRIQFIHESVRDYLRETGFQILAPNLGISLQGSTHDYIKDCCYRWISEDMERALALPEHLPKVSRTQELRVLRDAASKRFPLLEYSVSNVLHHAEQACCEGIPQEYFIKEFRWSPWVRINALFAKLDRDRYAEPANTLTYVLATQRASLLLKTELQLNSQSLGHDQLDAALRTSLGDHDPRMFMNILESGHSFDRIQLSGRTMEAAVKTQNLNLIRMITVQGLFTVHGFRERNSVLRTAVDTDNAQILGILLEQGALMPNEMDLVDFAIRQGRESTLRVLIAHGADLSVLSNDNGSLLTRACDYDRLAIARILVEHGASVNPKGDNLMPWQTTPLYAACYKRFEDLVQLLLQHGADPNLVSTGQSGLIEACSRGHEKVARMLLEHGADSNITNVYQQTPLLQACSRGHGDIAYMLLEHGADPNLANGKKETPLLEACSGGYGDIARILLEHGANPNFAGEWQCTPLLRACSNGHEDIARLLLEHGANVNICRREDLLASVNANTGPDDLLQALVLHGFDPSTDTRDGSEYLEAICAASVRGDKQTVRNLLANSTGVQHQVPDRYREVIQAVAMAFDGYNSEILSLLLDESEGFCAYDKAIYRDSLCEAERLGFSQIVKVLRKRGVTLSEDTAS